MVVRKRRFMELKIEFICQRNALSLRCRNRVPDGPPRPVALSREPHLYQRAQRYLFSNTSV